MMGCARTRCAAHIPVQGMDWAGQVRGGQRALGGDPEADCGKLRRQEVARVVGGFGMRQWQPHVNLGVNPELRNERLEGAHEVSHLERGGYGGRFGHRAQNLRLDSKESLCP